MSYTPVYTGGWKDWPDVSTPVNSAALTHIEAGITSASLASSVANTGDLTIQSDSGVVGTGDIIFKTGSTERMRIKNAGGASTPAGALQLGTALNLDISLQDANLKASDTKVIKGSGFFSGVYTEATVVGASPAGSTGRYQGFEAFIKDAATVANWTISGAVNNGSGLIRITATGHGLNTGDTAAVYGVGGTTEANGQWTVTKVDANHVDLQGSTFTNAYTSGGTITNRGAYYGAIFAVQPSLDRGLLTGTAAHGDDVDGAVAYNVGPGKGTDAFYVGAASGVSWTTAFTCDANADYGIRLNGTYTNYAIDLYQGNPVGAIRLPNNKNVWGRNTANNNDLNLFGVNTSDEFVLYNTTRLSGTTRVTDGINFELGTTTGTKIGVSTSQKLAFYNSNPVIQQNGTGNTHTVAAGATTSVFTNTTFDGSTGTTAYTVGDIVKALKAYGLLAA